MTLTIDVKKCITCGRCVSECPTKSMDWLDNAIVQVDQSICIACGHCAAVCPRDAISFNAGSAAQPFSVTDTSDDESKYDFLFRETRSVRKYTSESIDKDTIVRLISHAEMAPSGDNFRMREYMVVCERDSINRMEQLLTEHYKSAVRFFPPIVISLFSMYSGQLAHEVRFLKKMIRSHEVRKLDKYHSIFRDAPCVIFIIGPNGSILAKDDCVAAQHYMRLAATGMKLASCIIGFAQKSNGVLEKYLGMDKNKRIYAATIFGFQSNEFHKSIEYPKPVICWK